MLPWECKVIYFLTVCVVPRRNALANDVAWRALCQTLERLDQWNTYCVLVMPDHVHLLTAPLERVEAVAAATANLIGLRVRTRAPTPYARSI
jgi:REP element-mobilizing transposase RayT